MIEQEVFDTDKKVFTVSELIQICDRNLKAFGVVNVCGCVLSISRLKTGGLILDIADATEDGHKACISGWIFSDSLARVAADLSLKIGDKVIVTGRLWIKKNQSQVALSILSITKEGVSELLLKFEELRKRFQQLGYFDQSRKKMLPKFVKTVAVITSISSGVVLADFCYWWRILYPRAKLLVFDVPVQGEGSADAVSKTVGYINSEKLADVILIMRGGGSISDLWSFNEPQVVEAIFRSRIPVVTAIGHEADTTLADLVADLRAPTPTSAANQILPNRAELFKLIRIYLQRILNTDLLINFYDDLTHLDKIFFDRIHDNLKGVRSKLDNLDKLLSHLTPEIYLKEKFAKLSNLVFRFNTSVLAVKYNLVSSLERQVQSMNSVDMNFRVAKLKSTLSFLCTRLTELVTDIFSEKANRFYVLKNELEYGSPYGALQRGYTLVVGEDQKILDYADVEEGQLIKVMFFKGSIFAKVIRKDGRET